MVINSDGIVCIHVQHKLVLAGSAQNTTIQNKYISNRIVCITRLQNALNSQSLSPNHPTVTLSAVNGDERDNQ